MKNVPTTLGSALGTPRLTADTLLITPAELLNILINRKFGDKRGSAAQAAKAAAISPASISHMRLGRINTPDYVLDILKDLPDAPSQTGVSHYRPTTKSEPLYRLRCDLTGEAYAKARALNLFLRGDENPLSAANLDAFVNTLILDAYDVNQLNGNIIDDPLS